MKHRRLLLARHGRTDWNKVFRYQGTTDVPLDEEGREQARRLGRRLRGESFLQIVTSPLSRAVETAALVREALDESAPVRALSSLVELDFGLWEGLSVAEVLERHGDHYRAWREDPLAVSPPGGESFMKAVERVGHGLDAILDGAEGTSLVVCHGGTIRAALVALLSLPPSVVWRIRQDNCALTAVDVWDGSAMLAFSNDQSHLLVEEALIGSIPLAR